jgi:uncharacterized membrane protein YdjX (TVP38/TMEM64 family)
MPDDTHRRDGLSGRRLLPLMGLVAAGIAVFLFFGRQYLTFAAFAENRAQLQALAADWGVLAELGYIGLYTTLVALSVPGALVLTMAGGFLFGTWIGGSCAVVGATAGATLIFLAARAGLGDIAGRAGPFIAKLEAGFRADAFSYLLVLRLVPIFPFWLVNLVPAVLGVPLRSFVLATLIGVIPATFIYASLGNGLGDIVAQPDLGIVFHPSVFGPILALACLALVPVVYKRWRGGPRP